MHVNFTYLTFVLFEWLLLIFFFFRTFIPKSKSQDIIDNSRSTFLMKQYTNMSNQFLKLITTWCFSLLSMDIVYLAFTFFKFDSANSLTASERNGCIAIGVLLHFFLICSFCFSLSITSIQYFIFHKSFKIFKFIYVKAATFSLGDKQFFQNNNYIISL